VKESALDCGNWVKHLSSSKSRLKIDFMNAWRACYVKLCAVSDLVLESYYLIYIALPLDNLASHQGLSNEVVEEERITLHGEFKQA